MKRLNFPTQINLTLSPLTTGTIDPEDFRLTDHNRGEVLKVALQIEQAFGDIIADYFSAGSRERKDEFQELIGQSSWFSLENKRGIFLKIAVRTGLVSEKERNSLDETLAKLIEWRNAFAHGNIRQHDDLLKLHYYKGSHKERIMNHSFWTDVEEQLIKAVNAVEAVRVKHKERKATTNDENH